MGSVVVLVLLALAVGLALRGARRRRGSCGGHCDQCPGCGKPGREERQRGW